MKRFALLLIALLPALFLTACEEVTWDEETCSNNLAADVEEFEEYKAGFLKAKEGLADAERSGDAARIKALQQNVKDWKGNLEALVSFIDRDMIPECAGKFRADLVKKAEEVRKFVKESTGITTQKEEGMPDLRVTKIETVFIPYEIDENGSCYGPYLDVTYTVSNQGGDFPRPVDLENYTKRAQQPPEKLIMFNVYGELDFGNDSRTSADFEVKGGSGGILKGGASLKLKKKVLVRNDQTQGTAWGYVQTNQLTENASNAVRYETPISVPMWDVYTESHLMTTTKDSEGKTYIGMLGTVTNKGASPTPGPVRGSFVLFDAETGRQITSWSGETKGPVSGSERLVNKDYSKMKLPAKIRVQSSVSPVCPDGKSGNLADGNTKNSIRDLEQAPPSDNGAATSLPDY